MNEYTAKFTPDDRFLVFEEVQAIVKLSKSRLYALMNEGRFPRPVKLGVSRAAWIEAEIMAYVNDRINERNKRYNRKAS